MRTRQEIKAIGKERFSSFYWPCVGAAFLIMVVSGVVGGLQSVAAELEIGSLTFSLNIISILLTGPLAIGLNFFFIQRILGREDLTVGTPFETAFQNFGRKLGGYWWMQLFLVLWSLLLIIPGIIKYYAYAMTPYILADCPHVKAKDALKLSMRIMNGKKADLFIFHLSFIGWELLSLLTGCILQVFYVGPYIRCATACWYLEARENALRNGIITLGQLEGTQAV